ncbi:hypothetical protein RHSIM_Rhsim04G0106300 [Rhododendron simsii]|uniref:Uncharacterized protein n=1 Tax=Rhododendron simsii TaxID=118357 RepID=A0A834LRK8_RHOSS|nr:hypothetical protein RHSIM_Rhsim04G0106300 [Rhododendron simsii]
MGQEKGLDGDGYMQEFNASERVELGREAVGTSSATNGGQFDTEQKKPKKEDSAKTVPFYKLLSFADSVDVVSLNFVYLALGAGVAAFLQVSCWMVVGERQAARIRSLYLKTIMRQEIAFFDKEMNTGEVVGRMSGDTVLIQDALGEKVGKFIQLVSTFLGGFVIAFIKGWLLTLVLLSSIPLLVIAGGATSIFISKQASSGQNAYAKAAIVVEQTIGSIRTVASFTGEKQAVIKYNKSLVDAYKSGIHEGLASGLGFGAVMSVSNCIYALAIWFGAKMILDRGYTGGDVLNVIVAVLIGSMSLGQASPCMTAFAAGQAAAFKIIKDNIAYGKDGATVEEIKAAAELANASKFIDKLPQVITCCPLVLTTCSHSVLLEDPEGAYSQLIRLQEVRKDSKQAAVDKTKSDSISEIGRQSSQRMSFLRSISGGSSGPGNSSGHLKVSTGRNVPETTLPDAEEGGVQVCEKPPNVPLRRLAHLNKPEVPILIAGAIAAVISGSLYPISALMNAAVINTFYKPPHQLKKDTNFWALMYLVLGVVALLAYPARSYFFSLAGCKLIKRLRSICFEKVIQMEISWFDKPENSSGAIGARLSVDAATVRGLVGDALAQLVQDSASAIAGLVIAFTACWQLAFIVLALIPIIGVSGYVQLKFMQGFSADAKMMYEEASKVANDAVGSIRTVASFCAEEKVMQLYKKKCEGPMKTGKRQGLVSGIGFGVSIALLFLVYATSFYAGAKLVEAGETTFADVFRVFFALTMAAMGISQSSGLAPDATKAKGAAASIFAILDRKSKIDPSDESGITLESVKGDIELRNISFRYPSRPDVQIFHDLSLNIHSCKTVALVGESGSGKSTVIALLQRFYDPESGHITLDGIEIQKLQLKWLRQQMGLVSQEPVLFNETIRANIAYGKEGNATEAEILAASELANAHNFISGLQQEKDNNLEVGNMGQEKGLDGDGYMQEFNASERVELGREAVGISSATNGGQLDTEQKKSKKEDSAKTVPFYKLLSFVDSVDVVLMIVGTIGAVGNGISMPLMTVLLGDVINSFGQTQNNKEVVQEVSKVGKFIQLVSTFLGGFVIAFIKGWLLTLVLLSSIPLLVIAGGATSIFISKQASNGQNAYAKAAIVVEQTIGSIRTVSCVIYREKQAVIKYNKSLVDAYKSGIHEGLASGLGFGAVMSVSNCIYALAIWFGAKMILDRGYTGGDVLNVIVAVLIGSMSLGQASPCMTAFAAGSHSVLLEDPEGAYSQLIRLQEVSKDSKQAAVDQHNSDSISEIGRQSSQRMSFLRSISGGSSGPGNSSGHLKVSFGLPTGLNVPETTLPDAEESGVQVSEKPPNVPLRRLAHLNKPEVPILIAGAIAAVISGSLYPISALMNAAVINTFYKPPQQLKKDTNFWALMYLVLGVVALLAYPARSYFFSLAGCKLIKRLRSICFEKVIQMEISWFDKPENSSGAIGARLSVDAATGRGLVGDALAQLVQDSASAIAGLVIAFTACWQLAFIVLALIPIIGVSGYVQLKFMQGFSADAKMMYEEASKVANDAVGSIRTVASFCAEEKVMQLYKKKCEGPMKTGKRQGLVSGIGFGVSIALLFLVYATSFYAGAKLVEAGETTFADVFRVFFALTMAAMGISQSSGLAPDATKAKGAAASIFAILDRKSKIDPSDESGITLESVKGEIELCNISFRYPSRPDVQIFHDLGLNIHSCKVYPLDPSQILLRDSKLRNTAYVYAFME